MYSPLEETAVKMVISFNMAKKSGRKWQKETEKKGKSDQAPLKRTNSFRC